jgi:hypothetical protein
MSLTDGLFKVINSVVSFVGLLQNGINFVFSLPTVMGSANLDVHPVIC